LTIADFCLPIPDRKEDPIKNQKSAIANVPGNIHTATAVCIAEGSSGLGEGRRDEQHD
jgi:hypothetical protein